MQISCRLRPRALTDCWPKSKRAWTRLSALTRGSRALITGDWSLSETQRPRGPYAVSRGTKCESGGEGEEANENAQKKQNKTKKRVSSHSCSGRTRRTFAPAPRSANRYLAAIFKAASRLIYSSWSDLSKVKSRQATFAFKDLRAELIWTGGGGGEQ